jgi:hypothetical protein
LDMREALSGKLFNCRVKRVHQTGGYSKRASAVETCDTFVILHRTPMILTVMKASIEIG